MSTALTASTKKPCLLPSIVACAIFDGSAACAVATIVLITAVPTAPASCSVAVGVQLFRQLTQTIGHNRSHGKTLAEGKEQIEHNEEQRAQLARIKAVADDGYENGCIA